MPIKVVYEDQVDWEPLGMRFVAESATTRSESQAVARFIQKWIDHAAESNPDLWCMAKEWAATVTEDNTVIAQCEFMPEQEIKRLAVELGAAYPVIREIRLGTPLDGPTTTKRIKWLAVDGGEVTIGKQTETLVPFKISWLPITLGQFEEFLNATSYSPVADKIEKRKGFLLDHFRINFGRSPKHPLFGVTHDDALAFCEWSNLRLPTDHELKHFFHFACRQGRSFTYSGECWTSKSPAKDKFVVWNGPYRSESLSDPDRHFRKLLHRHQYEFLEAPCFRVIKT